MHILCTICSDLVNAAEDICITKCGHMFHHHCLAQWNERSKTCPQCRHSLTQKCVFRIYPTISNEPAVDDVTTLQSRLDDAKLTARQQVSRIKELEEKVATLTEDSKKNEKILHDTEMKLVIKQSAVSALKEQLQLVTIQNKEVQRLKDDNETLQRNLRTLNGLQKVLNATTEEVEKMLQTYNDVHTIATFAAALKRALCESECRKNESRDRVVELQRQLAREQQESFNWQQQYLATLEKLNNTEEKLKKSIMPPKFDEISKKQKTFTDFEDILGLVKKNPSLDETFLLPSTRTMDLDKSFLGDSDHSFRVDNNMQKSMVHRIENADSPYLVLKQNSLLPLSAIQRKQTKPPGNTVKPSDYINQSWKENMPSTSKKQDFDLSIFHTKPEPKIPQYLNGTTATCTSRESPYDGLGGHSKLDTFPVLKSPVKSRSGPGKYTLTTRHKLKRPMPSGTQDIESFLKRLKDK